jgi:hypothetical protein
MIAALLNNPKTDAEWDIWSYHHRISHDSIRAAILAQKSIDLPDYLIDPVDKNNIPRWLDNNSELHQDMDAALGVQSVDLEDVDFNNENQKVAWLYQHWQEHQTAELALGI